MLHHIILGISLLSIVKCSSIHHFIGRNRPVSVKPTVDLSNLKSTDYPGYRLPTNLRPTEYHLRFNASLSEATFKGQASITFNVINATDMIVLNVRFESISAESLKFVVNHSKPPVAITNMTVDKDHQMVWLQLNTTLKKQKKAILSVSYDGQLASDNLGFYLSSYSKVDKKGIRTEQ
jgi:aminopeptidase 2